MLFFYPESVVSNRLLKRHLAYKFFCRNLSDHMHIEVEFVSGSTAWPQWRQSHWGLKESEPSNLTPKLSKRIEDPEALPETLRDARRMPPL
jgi:hypothetical protein